MGSLDPTHANGTDKPCISPKHIVPETTCSSWTLGPEHNQWFFGAARPVDKATSRYSTEMASCFRIEKKTEAENF